MKMRRSFSTTRRNFPIRKRYCRFCAEKIAYIDYKNPELLSKYITEIGKVLPGRVTGTCGYHQKMLTKAIKRARIMGLLPFVVKK